MATSIVLIVKYFMCMEFIYTSFFKKGEGLIACMHIILVIKLFAVQISTNSKYDFFRCNIRVILSERYFRCKLSVSLNLFILEVAGHG